MIDWLRKEWDALILNYTDDVSLIETFWDEIKTQYSSNARYYHNFSHLHHMFLQLENYKNDIIDLDALKLAIWYHDIVYKSSRKNNEQKSADFAEKRLKSIYFDEKRLENIKKLIVSTKKHQILLKQNNDNSYLLDLDLSILGTDWITYKKYIENIRLEFKIYPEFMYNSGRKKVLRSFLERDALYFTKKFKEQFESQAYVNLKKEIELLN